MTEKADIFAVIDALIDRWCERRALKPLRLILTAYPPNGLTDGWHELYNALRDVRALCRDELPEADNKDINQVVFAIQEMLEDRR